MKALPKRKGNGLEIQGVGALESSLNESPSEKEGKPVGKIRVGYARVCLNESPSEKEGKRGEFVDGHHGNIASMKALPKRKGNSGMKPAEASPRLPQ